MRTIVLFPILDSRQHRNSSYSNQSLKGPLYPQRGTNTGTECRHSISKSGTAMRLTTHQPSPVETRQPLPLHTIIMSSINVSTKPSHYHSLSSSSSSSSRSQPTRHGSHHHHHQNTTRWHPPSLFKPVVPTPVAQVQVPAGASSIPDLREALNTLESQMSTLMSQRRILESKLEQAVRLQSPIHRLPKELLGTIFIIGVLQLEDEDSHPSIRTFLKKHGSKLHELVIAATDPIHVLDLCPELRELTLLYFDKTVSRSILSHYCGSWSIHVAYFDQRVVPTRLGAHDGRLLRERVPGLPHRPLVWSKVHTAVICSPQKT